MSQGVESINCLPKTAWASDLKLFVENKITNEPEKNANLIFEMLSEINSKYNGKANYICNDTPSSLEQEK